MMRTLLLLPLLAACSTVAPQDYAAWFSSSKGLQIDKSAAWTLANKVGPVLNECGVTIDALQALKDVMYNRGSDGMGLSILDVQKDILILAKQHIDPAKLNELYQILIGGFWRLPGGLTLPVSVAQPRAIEMILKHAEPEDLKDVYGVLYGYSGGIQLPQDQAQKLAIEAATAGADAPTFQSTYAAQKSKGQTAALTAAEEASVKLNLHGLVRRYAKDTKLYTVSDFQSYYNSNWLSEWISAPQEKRVYKDGKAYRASEYKDYFGDSWYTQWANDKTATQVRIADDGKKYTIDEFQQYYKDEWQTQWSAAAEVACQECSSPVQATGSAKDLLVV